MVFRQTRRATYLSNGTTLHMKAAAKDNHPFVALSFYALSGEGNLDACIFSRCTPSFERTITLLKEQGNEPGTCLATEDGASPLTCRIIFMNSRENCRRRDLAELQKNPNPNLPGGRFLKCWDSHTIGLLLEKPLQKDESLAA